MADLELRTYYQNRQKTIETDGWIDLVEELKELSEVINNVDSLNNEQDLWYARGQLSVLRQITSLEETTKQAMEELEI